MVFSGDMTWFVPSNANVNLAGTTTLEGNAVIKVSPTNYSFFQALTINGSLQCVAARYRPCVITSISDNSVGWEARRKIGLKPTA